jgi:lipopolysaccharide cholinephosphotransferase
MNKDKLKKIWNIELDIYDYFFKFCKIHKINHFLISGSALGSVRHQGFIPWDDDIDVGMYRKDFNKFLKFINNKLPEKFVVEYGPRKDGIDFILRIRNIHTTAIILEQKKQKIHHGIYIEVYPFDNVPDNIFLRKIHLNIVNYLTFILQSNYSLRISIPFLFRKFIVTVLGVSFFWKLFNKISSMFLSKTNTVNTVSISSYSKTKYYEFPIFYINELKIGKFMNKKVYLSKYVHQMLKLNYGNYMILPPIKLRKSNHSGIVFFDPDNSYLNYLVNEGKK